MLGPWTGSKNAENSSCKNICLVVFIYIISKVEKTKTYVKWHVALFIDFRKLFSHDHHYMVWITGSSILYILFPRNKQASGKTGHKVFWMFRPINTQVTTMGCKCPPYPWILTCIFAICDIKYLFYRACAVWIIVLFKQKCKYLLEWRHERKREYPVCYLCRSSSTCWSV